MVTLFFTAVAAQAENGPVFKAQQVSASTWYVEGLSALGTPANQNFISNAAFVITPAGVVVIDALGSPALAVRLLAEIKKVTPIPVTHVLVTHYHADHIYGLQTMKAAGAKILAHEAARVYLNSDTARLRLEASRQELAPWVNEETVLVAADEWISNDRSITIGGVTFEIKRVGPSHTPEDIAIYLPKEKVLFAGDLVFRSRIPYVGQADSRHWILALDQLLAFDTQVIVPGHGAISRQARNDMQLTRNYLEYLRSKMAQAARNMEPFEDAYKATDWSQFEHLPLFRIANRMNAYNTYLLLEHEAN
ncbi:MAG: MBL fold metallo-hydrolase [Comamonadaceae bacterium]|jgi:glyoxylase-like metal-dependent hydrolase (beta-lactamase superfamily II)